jgi:hypothetical protein
MIQSNHATALCVRRLARSTPPAMLRLRPTAISSRMWTPADP